MLLPQPIMNHKIMQLAYVVNDLQEAAARWTNTFGIGPFFIVDRPEIGDPHYRGRPQGVEISTALAQAGDVHVELVQQHCDSPSCYRDLIPKGKEGFHHVGVIVEDYEAELARYQAQGFEVAMSGTFGPMKFCYVDTSPHIFCMVEVLENVPFIHDFFGRIKKAAEVWDGSNPLRPASEL